MPACPHQNDDLEWKIFNGCFHSTQSVFKMWIIAICQGYLQLVIEQLSITAKDSIFNGQENGATASANPENSTKDKPPKVQEETNEVLSAKIKEINEDLSTLTILEPDSALTQHQVFTNLPVSNQSRPPHCKTCGHLKKGHRTVQAKKFCPMCANQQCSPCSKDDKCQCEWHTKSI